MKVFYRGVSFHKLIRVKSKTLCVRVVILGSWKERLSFDDQVLAHIRKALG